MNTRSAAPHRWPLLALALCFSAPNAHAQSYTTLAGPSLGYVWNVTDATVRPLQGILGTATVGVPVDLGVSLASAEALNSTTFLASSSDSSSLLRIRMDGVSPAIVSLSDVPAFPTLVAASLQILSAALYYEESRTVRMVSGLLATPYVAGTVDLSLADAPPTHLAVSDDGSFLLYVIPREDGDLIYGWDATQGTRLLMSAGSVAAMVLAPNGDAVVADAAANEVFLISDPGTTAARRFLADASAGVATPSGLAVSETGRILVTSAASKTVLDLGFDGSVLSSQSCECDLGGLFPLTRSIYRLSARADQTIYLLDAGSPGDRVLFVPQFRASE